MGNVLNENLVQSVNALNVSCESVLLAIKYLINSLHITGFFFFFCILTFRTQTQQHSFKHIHIYFILNTAKYKEYSGQTLISHN